AVPDEHEAIGRGVRQGAQQHLIQEAENRRVRADAEREREHRDQREDRLLPQRTERVPDVLHGAVLDGPKGRKVVVHGSATRIAPYAHTDRSRSRRSREAPRIEAAAARGRFRTARAESGRWWR